MRPSRFTALSKGLRRQRGEMNRTERRYADHLDLAKVAGAIADYWFEPLTLRLTHPEQGQPAKVTPDFLVLMPDGETYLDDVKGSGLDDPAAIVRMKCAAELYPLWKFRIIKERTKKAGGGWEVREL